MFIYSESKRSICSVLFLVIVRTVRPNLAMEYQGIEKLRGAENWNVWKFVVKNLLSGTEKAHEVCIGEFVKPVSLPQDATAEQQGQYQATLKAWDKADRAASQIIVRTLETKVMALLISCDNARDVVKIAYDL